ncbi:serine/threonine-protein kinase [Rhodopirellula europaea]|uniref:Serine/threonine-protein kinase n=1 Tax=Rhodopirellula europaea 6C TaxID=1263867 RepID=M2APM4_9BACT|nr:serine/threonine-protein kinase [Rhodopirellula europaea]EMB19025.1 serine/threonine-protein kinase [Rhodopirellula europaea 6C]
MSSRNDAPTEAARIEDDQADPPAQHFGRYRIIRTLGTGGMGEVYLAEDTTTGQEVALKLLQHQVSKQSRMRRRFEREANLIQELRHDHIVPLLDSGIEQGTQYLVMRYIDGATLADRILKANGEQDSGEFSIDAGPAATTLNTEENGIAIETDSFELVAKSIADVADALQVAHDERVIHRDIKPSNLIFDSDGKIWLTDFGLALIEDQNTALTLTGDILGTPAYMSPEQTIGSQTDITRRSDIYSLGATLYEWATLQRPFQGNRDQILANVANGSLATPRQIRGDLPRPLEAIICKAMSRSPDARYTTAAEFARDLRRFADGKPVQAKMPGWPESFLRWSRRNPLVAVATLIGVITLVMTVLGMQAIHSGQLTRVNEKLAESNDELIATNLELESREAQLSEQLYVSDMSLAFQAFNGHNLKATKQLLDKHRPKAGELGSSRFAFQVLDYLITPPPSNLLTQHNSPATEVAISRDARIAISVSEDGEVHVIDLQSGKCTHRYKLSGRLDAIAISPDNESFLTGLNGDVGFNTISIHEIASGKQTLELLGHWHNIESAAFSSDGTLFATAGRYRDIQVHRRDGTAVKTIYGGSRNESLQFAGDGHSLAYAKEVGEERVLHVTDLDTEQEIRSPIAGESIHFSIVQPEGGPYRIVSFGGKHLKVADSTNTMHFAQAFAFNSPVRCVAISADGEDLYAGTDDGLIYAWTLTNRFESGDLQPPMIFQAAEGQISSIQVIPTNDESVRIVTTGEDGQVRLWDLADKLPVRPNPVGRTFVTAHIINVYSHSERPFDVFVRLDDGSVWHYDPRRDLRRMLPIKCELAEWGFQLGCDSQASKIAIASSKEVEVRDVASSELLAQITPPHETEEIADVKFVDGKLCVLLSKLLLVYDAEDYSLVETHALPSDNNTLLLNVPNSDALMIKASNMLSIYQDSTVAIFEASTSAAVRYVRVDFDAAASRIAVVFDNRLVEVRSYPENETIAVLRGHSKPIADSIFLDRGRTLATTGEDGLIRFWDLSSEREMGSLPTGEHLEGDLHRFVDTDLLMVTSTKSPAELLLTKQSRDKLDEQRRAIGLD